MIKTKYATSIDFTRVLCNEICFLSLHRHESIILMARWSTDRSSYDVVAYCRSTRYDSFSSFMLLSPPPSINHRYNHPFNRRVYNAIITYRFRSRLLVLSMYHGNRSRINRTGNEFSVLEKRRKQSIGRAQMARPDRLSFGHAHYVRVSICPVHSFSVVRTIRCSLCYVLLYPSKMLIKSLIIDFNPWLQVSWWKENKLYF